ncbi:hypothetical protein PLESTF_001689300 [Pleodorina starrii]|nr:hypothetical protein PLESTF_001689300 [Pleodorina starrii]
MHALLRSRSDSASYTDKLVTDGMLKPEMTLAGSGGTNDGSRSQAAVDYSSQAKDTLPDDEAFQKMMDDYFAAASRDELQESEAPDEEDAEAPMGTLGPRAMMEAIKAVQAEISDADLHLKDVISRGAFGVVYRGQWRGLPVAVKILVVSQELASKEGTARQRAALEAAISMSMAHPNVVVTYSYQVKSLVHVPETAALNDYDTQQGTRCARIHGAPTEDANDAIKLYIVQEYCNGRTLRDALDQGMAGCILRGGAHRLLALHLALDVARGMQHIHSCRIVHGDLKPENVLLVWRPQGERAESSPTAIAASNPGKTHLLPPTHLGSSSAQQPRELVAKVADFGLSLPLTEGATHASRCYNGTPAYRAPEVSSAGQLSPRADVWSFGLMLIEVYFGCSLKEVLDICADVVGPAAAGGCEAAGSQQPPDTLLLKGNRALLGAISDRRYAELAGRCLTLQPRARPSFDEISGALEDILAGFVNADR